MRLVKALRGKLDALVPSTLAAVEPHLARIASTPLEPLRGAAALGRAPLPANASNVDDRLYSFEAVGHLLGSDALSAEDQARLLASLLGPLVAQVQSNLAGCVPGQLHPLQQAASERRVQQALLAVAHVSKGFSLTLLADRPALGALRILFIVFLIHGHGWLFSSCVVYVGAAGDDDLQQL